MAVSPSDQIAHRVNELRKARGWSAHDLAKRCSAAGAPWLNRSVIANLESGRRAKVTMEELTILAYVLDVSPLSLFLPTDGLNLAITSHVQASRVDVLRWIRGEAPLPGTDSRIYFTQVPDIEWLQTERMLSAFPTAGGR